MGNITPTNKKPFPQTTLKQSKTFTVRLVHIIVGFVRKGHLLAVFTANNYEKRRPRPRVPSIVRVWPTTVEPPINPWGDPQADGPATRARWERVRASRFQCVVPPRRPLFRRCCFN